MKKLELGALRRVRNGFCNSGSNWELSMEGCRHSQPWGSEEVPKQCQLTVPLPKALLVATAELCQGRACETSREMLTDTEGPRLQPGNIPGTATSYRNTAKLMHFYSKGIHSTKLITTAPTTPPRLPGSCDSSLTMATLHPRNSLETGHQIHGENFRRAQHLLLENRDKTWQRWGSQDCTQA